MKRARHGVHVGVEICKGLGNGKGDGLEIGKKIKPEGGWGWPMDCLPNPDMED